MGGCAGSRVGQLGIQVGNRLAYGKPSSFSFVLAGLKVLVALPLSQDSLTNPLECPAPADGLQDGTASRLVVC